MQSLNDETLALKKVFSFQHPLWSHRLPAGEGGAPSAIFQWRQKWHVRCNFTGGGIGRKALISQEHNPREEGAERETCQGNKKQGEAGWPYLVPEASRCAAEVTGMKGGWGGHRLHEVILLFPPNWTFVIIFTNGNNKKKNWPVT